MQESLFPRSSDEDKDIIHRMVSLVFLSRSGFLHNLRLRVSFFNPSDPILARNRLKNPFPILGCCFSFHWSYCISSFASTFECLISPMFYCARLDLCSWLSPSWNNPFTSPSCLRRWSPTDWKYIDISERCWSFYIWKRVNCQKLSMLSIKFPWYNNTQQYVASKSFQICTFVSHNGNKTSLHR